MSARSTSWLRSLSPVAAWMDFWFRPVDPVGLHRLRILAGAIFFLWLLPLAGHVDTFFGLGGWFDRTAYNEAARLAARYGEEPPLPYWSLLYLCQTPAAAQTLYATTLGIIGLFTLGIAPRLTGLLTYLLVSSFTAAPAIPYDADPFLIMSAFYLAVGYFFHGLGENRWSLRSLVLGSGDAWLFGRRKEGEIPAGSRGANLGLRLWQIHFALAMLVTGLHKFQYPDWWHGVAYWFSLHKPFDYTIEDLQILKPVGSNYLSTLSLMAYATLAWQVAFPSFAWRRGWFRFLLLGGSLCALIGSMMFEMPLIGPLMVLGCLTYLTPEEWRLWRWFRPWLRGETSLPALGEERSGRTLPTPVPTGGSRR